MTELLSRSLAPRMVVGQFILNSVGLSLFVVITVGIMAILFR